VTAVAASNDYVAAMALNAARLLGLRVPADLAVIGVDDDPMAALLDPPLSSVRLDMAALADTLLAQGLALLEGGEPPPGLASATVQLVVRAST